MITCSMTILAILNYLVSTVEYFGGVNHLTTTDSAFQRADNFNKWMVNINN